MKKIAVYTLSIAFIAAGMTSCAKSTKGKVTNDWKIVSYLKTDSFYNAGGQSDTITTNMTETSLTQHSVITDNGMALTYDNTGTVNAHSLTIKKDGTWSRSQDLTFDFGNGNQQRTVIDQSGTWTFVGKTKGDDFKKNERILLNVLTNKRTSNQINNQVVVAQNSNSDTYLTGENVWIYTIKESKRDELELELVNTVTNASETGGTNSNTLSENITLKEK
jgi:hypothetical protein